MKTRYFACLWQSSDLPPWSSGVFGVRDVALLNANLKRFDPDAHLTILVDEFFDGEDVRAACDEAIRFRCDDVGGFSRVLECYSPEIQWWPTESRRILVGLDTVFTGDLEWLKSWDLSEVGLPRDPLDPRPVPCNGVCVWTRDGGSLIWDEYLRCLCDGMGQDRIWGVPSEMHLLRRLFDRHGWHFLEDEPKRVISYKAHYRRGASLDDASVVYFHGQPKPKDLPKHDPVRLIWEGVA